MHITGIGTATPVERYTKAQCLDAFMQSDWYARLTPRSTFLVRHILQRDNGIEARHLAVPSLEDVFQIDPNTLARRFLDNAPKLATLAAERALADSNIDRRDIGAVVVSTCTGYLCPGLSGHVIEGLGLNAGTLAFDLVGQGCGAALPNLQLGEALLATGRHAHVLSVCVEVSSAAMYLDDDAGVLVSACLFGDGAGAAVLSAARRPGRRSLRWVDSTSLMKPAHRAALMFEQRDGLLRNILTRAVPALAASHARNVLETVLARHAVLPQQIGAWIMHAGGRDVLIELCRSLSLEQDDLRYSVAMLRQYGNLSSAFVYFVLEAALRDGAPDGWWWLSSFGAGFSCHGALLEART